MKDREFLMWIHDRLRDVHNEDENLDYMYKLRSIIDTIDADQITPNITKVVKI